MYYYMQMYTHLQYAYMYICIHVQHVHVHVTYIYVYMYVHVHYYKYIIIFNIPIGFLALVTGSTKFLYIIYYAHPIKSLCNFCKSFVPSKMSTSKFITVASFQYLWFLIFSNNLFDK